MFVLFFRSILFILVFIFSFESSFAANCEDQDLDLILRESMPGMTGRSSNRSTKVHFAIEVLYKKVSSTTRLNSQNKELFETLVREKMSAGNKSIAESLKAAGVPGGVNDLSKIAVTSKNSTNLEYAANQFRLSGQDLKKYNKVLDDPKALEQAKIYSEKAQQIYRKLAESIPRDSRTRQGYYMGELSALQDAGDSVALLKRARELRLSHKETELDYFIRSLPGWHD